VDDPANASDVMAELIQDGQSIQVYYFFGSDRVQDDYALKLNADGRELESYLEWTLISQGDEFRDALQSVVEKLRNATSGGIRTGVPCRARS
jgi:hypothetical protein